MTILGFVMHSMTYELTALCHAQHDLRYYGTIGVMVDYRRYFVPGGTYFFTVVVHERRPLFEHATARSLLGSVLRRCLDRWPFEIDAIVLLPNHWHTPWSLPSGDNECSKRLGWIKKEFTKHWLQIGGAEGGVKESKTRQRRRGVWQPRFWEHTIRDEEDFDAHFDYIHWNPVKHGYVKRPRDWPYSSFHRWVNANVYPDHWGCFTDEGDSPPRTVLKVKQSGEP